ncbi:MAG: M42 family metallopeptidase [bacterium]|nr:M42 family metallopeptidase [bacterium]
MKDLIKQLCGLNGVSGREGSVSDYIFEQIKDYADVNIDTMGNIIAFKKGKKSAGKRIMVDAHIDEVGFIITSVDERGMCKFSTVGGIDIGVMCGKRVLINDSIAGVISSKPIHMLDADQRKKMPKPEDLYIDIGAESRQEALQYVNPGDVAVFDAGFYECGEMMVGKALDDRVGCAVLINLIKQKSEYDFYATFTVQEEVGLRGAKTAAYSVDPDSAIILETTTAADIAGVADNETVCRVGSGAVISFMDRSTLYDRGYYDMAFEVADRNNIKCQAKSAVAGGNNAGAVHSSRSGVRTVALSLPCRYIHSQSCAASYSDVEALYNLAKAMIEEIAQEK